MSNEGPGVRSRDSNQARRLVLRYVWEMNVGVRWVGAVTMLGSRGQMGWKSGGRGRG